MDPHLLNHCVKCKYFVQLTFFLLLQLKTHKFSFYLLSLAVHSRPIDFAIVIVVIN